MGHVAKHFAQKVGAMAVLLGFGLNAFVGCSPSRQTGAPPAPVAKVDGGSDGSGGVTGVSTQDQVRAKFELAKSSVKIGFNRFAKLLRGSQRSNDPRLTEERKRILALMLAGTPLEPLPIADLLAQNLVSWDLRTDGSCHATDGRHADGAARPPRTVCISLYRLTRFPFLALEPMNVQLIAHEAAHLYVGDDEAAAIAIDSLFSESPDIVAADMDRVREIDEITDFIQARVAERMTAFATPPSHPYNQGFPDCGNIMLPYNQSNFFSFLDIVFKKSRERVFYPSEFLAGAEAVQAYIKDARKVQNEMGWDHEHCAKDPARFFLKDRLPELDAKLKRAVVAFRDFYEYDPNRK